ncbi:ATP-binding protein, partial [Muricoccus vinaceus]
LTGGVAHDFNNLLTVILGSSETLVESLGGDEELRGLAEMTMTAAERGAALTSQLLAFSRRQTLEPRVVEVGAVLGGLASMLGRTLGAHIALHLSSAPELWPALIDQSQLENAVLNLCINARDAMPAGGSLVIASSNLEVAGGGPADGELSPGRYVVIEVVDSGTGMAPEVLGRAFEPFFTTKEVGQGSGLGLSMVYGFMKQSGGHVELASTPGRGTTVRMVLKAAAGAAAPAPARPAREAGGAERVLLVEDDAMVRTHVAAMLRGLGYTVTLANNAAEGLARLEAGEPFELLLSDVVMPGAMNGLQLAVRARQMRPAIGLLLTSGYTENAIQQHGSLEPGM